MQLCDSLDWCQYLLHYLPNIRSWLIHCSSMLTGPQASDHTARLSFQPSWRSPELVVKCTKFHSVGIARRTKLPPQSWTSDGQRKTATRSRLGGYAGGRSSPGAGGMGGAAAWVCDWETRTKMCIYELRCTPSRKQVQAFLPTGKESRSQTGHWSFMSPDYPWDKGAAKVRITVNTTLKWVFEMSLFYCTLCT